MSSIFGKCHKDVKPVDLNGLKIMKDELNHWNADDSNLWISGSIGLGHLMLYNTPESLNEKQPLHNSTMQISITADARVDNRDELYPLLQINTPEEKLMPDSSIILFLYKKYGENCVKYLVGDFTFAIWDEKEQKLFCARDQIGVKPFFYYNSDHFFAFASEKKGLLCIPGIDKSIDKQFFYNQVFHPPIQAADTTLYKNIRRLAPAHTLTWYASTNKLELRHYWTLDAFTETKFQRKDDYYEGLLHHFETAVQCRLRTVYPIGAQLSGGLDSSAITGVANHFLKSSGKYLITFSNTYSTEGLAAIEDTPSKNEQKYMEAVISFNGIKDSVFVTKNIWDDPLEEADFALKVNDGLELWSPLWLMPINKAAMLKNVRTLLSGFPGDEMVTYRGQFYYLDYLDKKQYLKYFLAKKRWPFNKLKPFLTPDIEFCLHKIKNILTMNSKEIRFFSEFYKIPAKGRYAKGDVVWKDINYRERFTSYRHFQKYRLLKPQVALRMEAETRFGLYFKTESRYPMADIRLTQFYLSMPNYIKCDGELERNAYRTAIQKYLPDLVLQRNNKTGNIAPFIFSPQSVSIRKETLSEMLDIIGKMHKNIIPSQPFGNKYYKINSIEILRWFEKNFESL